MAGPILSLAHIVSLDRLTEEPEALHQALTQRATGLSQLLDEALAQVEAASRGVAVASETLQESRSDLERRLDRVRRASNEPLKLKSDGTAIWIRGRVLAEGRGVAAAHIDVDSADEQPGRRRPTVGPEGGALPARAEAPGAITDLHGRFLLRLPLAWAGRTIRLRALRGDTTIAAETAKLPNDGKKILDVTLSGTDPEATAEHTASIAAAAQALEEEAQDQVRQVSALADDLARDARMGHARAEALRAVAEGLKGPP